MSKPTVIPKVYWDSCVFTSLIEGTADRIEVITHLANEAEQGRLEICTSLFTIAEVAFIKLAKNETQIDPAAQEKIDELWKPGSIVKLYEPHHAIMVASASLVRDAKLSGFSIKAKDAIHIATAMSIGITSLHTYDGFSNKWTHLKTLTGITISRPETIDPSLFDLLPHPLQAPPLQIAVTASICTDDPASDNAS